MSTSPLVPGDRFSAFDREAFRLEVLGEHGSDWPEEYRTGSWSRVVMAARRAGKRMYRVHVLTRPLSACVEADLEWGLIRHVKAGEEYHVLDVTEQENPVRGVPDFWLFDDETVAAPRYGEDGRYLGVGFPDAGEAARFRAYRDAAMARAVPFEEWWATYGT
ncbi:DUF6879 family protein [Kitasatospora sp. NPDC057692]|uniref:DUF6879 family protein n=1 Tax=Kitasatospora sp. NPDC057692 TaxID=3346215 RepID=UPI0036AF36D8